jgi:dTDP-4-dehydrorhamnose reductase
MPRVLVLGATGLLGHKLFQVLGTRFETWGTARNSWPLEYFDLDSFGQIVTNVDAFDFNRLLQTLERLQPNVIVNSIGIIKQRPISADPIVSITLNSLFPQRLAAACRTAHIRLIHISTDCVFSGKRGMYRETDVADAEDLYGRTKYLGEVAGSGCLTLRTSIIGRELQGAWGLVEWLLGHKHGRVRGFTRAVFSGLTTAALANAIRDLIEFHPDLYGPYHISSEPIDKYTLLEMLRNAYHLDVSIDEDDSVVIDRSLDSSLFRSVTGFRPQSWTEMVAEMAADPTRYEDTRNTLHAS